MKKTIAIICEYVIFPERIGGMDYFFVAYDSVLKEKGYDVIWFFKNVEYFDFYDDLNIINTQNKPIESFFIDYCISKNKKFNIVITHFLQPVSPFFKEIKKRMNSYIINVDHNPRPLEGFPFKKRIKNKIKGLLFGKYIDKLVGVSEYTTKHIINDFGSHLKNRTITIYNGIETSIYKKQKLDRSQLPVKFVVVSHLRESKGIQDLLIALSMIAKDNYIVDIYGDGPFKQQLLQLKEKYKLQNVFFKGNSSKLNDLLCNYHYLIQPTYMECFSLSILESLASNVPVITTTVGGNLEVVTNKKNGYIFNAKDVHTLSKIMESIISREAIIIGDVSQLIEEGYTLDKMVKNHLKLVTCI